jgi:hypothetical protein
MNPGILDSLLQHPVGQLVVTVVVAVVTSVVTVRLMMPRTPAPSTIRQPAPDTAQDTAEDPALIAVITAAVYAAIGPHRIVFIGETSPGSSWTAAMRTRHHASHALTRTRSSPE